MRAHDLVRGPKMAAGMGVTRCRDSAEPLREDTGDEVSLAMAYPLPLSCCRLTERLSYNDPSPKERGTGPGALLAPLPGLRTERHTSAFSHSVLYTLLVSMMSSCPEWCTRLHG